METSIAERIAARIAAMPAGEQRAAQALVADYPLAGLRTVAELSAQAGVSSPTILRFVARLGFDGYAEFQAAVRQEVAAQLQSPLARASAPRTAAGADPFIEATLENIRATFAHVPRAQIADMVALLARPRSTLYLAGGRFTDPIARYLAAHLTLVRPDVVHLAGQESAWHDRLVDIGRRDVLLVLDIRRYQESLLRMAGGVRARGATVILFTDQWLSPIARFARHVIAGRTAVPSPWDSSSALMAMSEILVAELTRTLGEKGERRIRAIENLRS